MSIYFPALLLGLIVGAYWARVIKMVLKQRRRTGRDANFVPRETLGLVLRFIWYPVVAMWVAHPYLNAVWINPPSPFRPLYDDPRLAWAGVCVAAMSLGFTWICWKRMGKSWRMGIDPNEKTQLIFSGPYAFVRHPIYALSCLLMIASALTIPSMLMLILATLHILFLQWEASREERYLVQTHGQAYTAYRRHVGRMLPRSLSAYRGESGA